MKITFLVALLLLPSVGHAQTVDQDVTVDGAISVIPVQDKSTIVEGEIVKFSVPVATGKTNVGFALDKVDKGVEFTAVVQVTEDGKTFMELCRGAGVGKGVPVSISCGDRFTNKASLTRAVQGTLSIIKGTTESAIDATVK